MGDSGISLLLAGDEISTIVFQFVVSYLTTIDWASLHLTCIRLRTVMLYWTGKPMIMLKTIAEYKIQSVRLKFVSALSESPHPQSEEQQLYDRIYGYTEGALDSTIYVDTEFCLVNTNTSKIVNLELLKKNKKKKSSRKSDDTIRHTYKSILFVVSLYMKGKSDALVIWLNASDNDNKVDIVPLEYMEARQELIAKVFGQLATKYTFVGFSPSTDEILLKTKILDLQQILPKRMNLFKGKQLLSLKRTMEYLSIPLEVNKECQLSNWMSYSPEKEEYAGTDAICTYLIARVLDSFSEESEESEKLPCKTVVKTSKALSETNDVIDVVFYGVHYCRFSELFLSENKNRIKSLIHDEDYIILNTIYETYNNLNSDIQRKRYIQQNRKTIQIILSDNSGGSPESLSKKDFFDCIRYISSCNIQTELREKYPKLGGILEKTLNPGITTLHYEKYKKYIYCIYENESIYENDYSFDIETEDNDEEYDNYMHNEYRKLFTQMKQLLDDLYDIPPYSELSARHKICIDYLKLKTGITLILNSYDSDDEIDFGNNYDKLWAFINKDLRSKRTWSCKIRLLKKIIFC